MCADGQASFTPTEVQFPIQKIVLSSEISSFGKPAGESFTILECTTDDCFVEFSNNHLLDYDLVRKEIKAGTYRYITISSCKEDDLSFKAKVKGSVTIGANTFYSHATEAFLLQDAAQPEQYVDVTFTQCDFYYELQTDMVISDSTVTPLRLFYDIHKLGWGIREVQNIESGCFQGELGSDATVYSLCIGVPHLIPVSTSTTPTIDRYHIYNSGQVATTAGGMMTFYLDSDNQILGGFARRIYSATSQNPSIDAFDMAIKRATLLDTGVYTIETFGTSFDSTALRFPAFSLSSHTTKTYTNAAGFSFSYQAGKAMINLSFEFERILLIARLK